MISEAGVMSKPVSRGTPSPAPPSPIRTWRSARSFRSMTRRQRTLRESMPSGFPCCRWLSTSEARRLFAEVMAWKSPVKCRLMSPAGTTIDLPPPVAPPFRPNVGPSDGSRRASATLSPFNAMPCARPIEIVVLPSPAEVGVSAVTRMTLPGLRRAPAGRARLEADLGLVVAVRNQMLPRDPEIARDFRYRTCFTAAAHIVLLDP